MSDYTVIQSKLALSGQELDYLDGFLGTSDRGGFYLGYYNISRSHQAVEQAQISTFSEFAGGVTIDSAYTPKRCGVVLGETSKGEIDVNLNRTYFPVILRPHIRGPI